MPGIYSPAEQNKHCVRMRLLRRRGSGLRVDQSVHGPLTVRALHRLASQAAVFQMWLTFKTVAECGCFQNPAVSTSQLKFSKFVEF